MNPVRIVAIDGASARFILALDTIQAIRDNAPLGDASSSRARVWSARGRDGRRTHGECHGAADFTVDLHETKIEGDLVEVKFNIIVSPQGAGLA
jgi:hypothetical protein